MSYCEENGQVVLTMSLDDWQLLMVTFGYAIGAMTTNNDRNSRDTCLRLLNRLNEGNGRYKPYQVGAEKG